MVDRQWLRRERRIASLMIRAEAALLESDETIARAQHLEPVTALAELDLAFADCATAGDDVALSIDRAARLRVAIASGKGHETRRSYVERFGVAGVRRFHAGPSTQAYLLPVETFPHHINNVYFVVAPGHALLFDVGSGSETSRRDLALAFSIVRTVYGEERASWEGLDTMVVSHAHIDHFGGLNAARVETSARLAVHELDARVLACFEERIVVASKDLDVFLRRAGVSEGTRTSVGDMYRDSKRFFKSVEPDRALRDHDLVGAGWRVHHVPGHCPGLICLQVNDVLLTSDHVLARITPHQFPQAITPFGGLEHYFHSLAKIRRLEGINLALGGHEEPIDDLRTRIDEIALFHRERCRRVLEACAAPATVVDVSRSLFGERAGYDILLALEEAGAHVEYLHALGRLRIGNLDEVASASDPIIRYVARR